MKDGRTRIGKQFQRVISEILTCIERKYNSVLENEINRGRCFILALGGDYITARAQGKSSEEQDQAWADFDQYVLGRIETVIKWDAKFAVPGNHDVLRSPNATEGSGADFAPMIRFFEQKPDWITPLSSTQKYSALIDPALVGGRKIRILLINSARRCGRLASNSDQWSLVSAPESRDSKIEFRRKLRYTDASEFGSAQETSMESELANEDDDFRFALMHHSPVPHQTIDTDEEEGDPFLDAGRFMGFALKNKVKLLLSGHDHEPSTLFVSPATTYSDRIPQPGTPYIQNGILCATAPTCLNSTHAITPGLNFVTICLQDPVCIAKIDISNITLHREQTFTEIPRSFQVASQGLDSERISLWNKFIRRIYNFKSGLDALKRIEQISPNDDLIWSQFQEEFFRARGYYSGYAVNVLPPERWWHCHARHTLAGLAQPMICAAARDGWRNSGDNSVKQTLIFQFSTSIFRGLTNALSNAKNIRVSELASSILSSHRLPNLEEHYFIEFAITNTLGDSIVNKWNSVSIWDNVPARKRRNSKDDRLLVRAKDVTEISYQDFGGDPNLYGRIGRKPGPHEVCRILLWSLEELAESPYSFSTIKLHEELKVPLFWLDPTRIRGINGNLRKPVGYYTAIGGSAQDKPFLNWTNKSGAPPSREELHCRQEIAPRVVGNSLWGHKNVPPSLKGTCLPYKEFQFLVRRPDILLAADAWTLLRLGFKDNLLDFLNGFDRSQIDSWLRE